MNNDTNTGLINDTFKWLVFLTPVSFTIFILLISIMANTEILGAIAILIILGVVALPIINIVFFIKDRDFLRAKGAFCPHWGWWFLQPVYVFKRVRRNGDSLSWFWLYMGLNVLLPRLVDLFI